MDLVRYFQKANQLHFPLTQTYNDSLVTEITSPKNIESVTMATIVTKFCQKQNQLSSGSSCNKYIPKNNG